MRYYHDTQDGRAVRLINFDWVTLAEFVAMGGTPRKANRDGNQYMIGQAKGDFTWLPVDRAIQYKTSGPSLHECDARCLSGEAHGRCECRCGGKNHGRGSAVAVAVAV